MSRLTVKRLKAAGDIGGDIEHAGDDRRRGQAIGYPVALLDDPTAAVPTQGRIRPRCEEPSFWSGRNAIPGIFKRLQQIDRRLDASFRLEMRNQTVNLGLGFGTEPNHALGVRWASVFRARIRSMLALTRSSTGSIGTISPAAIWASLRSSKSTIHCGGAFSGNLSMAFMLIPVWGYCQ